MKKERIRITVPKIIIGCPCCRRVKLPDGNWSTTKSNEISCTELCEYCTAMSLFKRLVSLNLYIRWLVIFVQHNSSEIAEANLQNVRFEAELTEDGFVFKFTNDMELGLDMHRGMIRYYGRDKNGTYRGQIMNDRNARKIYAHVTDMLLALPTKPEPTDAEPAHVG